MKICYISPETFSWGYHGGFGFLTRTLSRELAKRGIDVSIVTERRGSQGELENLDGVKVYGFNPKSRRGLHSALLSKLDSVEYYRTVDADIYHSQAVSYNTLMAQLSVPHKKHIITFQDPYDLAEWHRISQVDSRYRLTPKFKMWLILERRLLSTTCHRSHALYTQAHFLCDKSSNLFNLSRIPCFLPNPVEVPSREMVKTEKPQVCFLARWDPQKRVEIFFKLAKRYPDIAFIAMGHSHDPSKDAYLRQKAENIPNLTCTGFVSEREKSRILEESWALVNTSIREALPVAFLEALAHETPIISGENPDDLTEKYGYHVVNDDYSKSLEEMLQCTDRYRKGKKGRSYVRRIHELDRVVKLHIETYQQLIEGGHR